MSVRPNGSASGMMLSAVAPRPWMRISAPLAVSSGAPPATTFRASCGPLMVAPELGSHLPKRGEEAGVRIGICRQAEADLEVLDGGAGARAERAVDPADIVAER